VSDTESPLGLDPGLLARFRAAGTKIAWRPVAGPSRGRSGTTRIAHLHDEEARVERSGGAASTVVTVDAGPVGALVLLLEIDRRGLPAALGSQEAGRSPAFPSGAIAAAWGSAALRADARPTVGDLVELARYAKCLYYLIISYSNT